MQVLCEMAGCNQNASLKLMDPKVKYKEVWRKVEKPYEGHFLSYENVS